ncbi:peroxidase 4-like [Cucumis melo var. makuwa]|uniref:Peroxidase 4-like n=1 Tax=Cucumis melo var. makuwa TaxID=1194695 RepID=A0A5A7V8W8_CUCMM|nr:peroxidase 4-like [Cucumis melo var. makuwa]
MRQLERHRPRDRKEGKGTSDFQKVMVFALGHSILLGGVGTRTLVDNAFGRQKFIKGVVLELSTMVTLQNSNLCIELRFYDVIEVPEDRGDFRFVGDKKDPGKTSIVIDKGDEPPFSR